VSKKGYLVIAEVVSRIEDVDIRRQVALDFVQKLSKDNPVFDAKRFLKICLASES